VIAFKEKKDRLILALDLDDKKKILSLVHQTKNYIGVCKIGPRLFLREGPSLIDEIKQKSPSCKIFLDFKFYDIPSSTLSAVRSAFEIGASFVTVHASVGEETLKKLAEFESSVQEKSFFKVLCVTVLSSADFSSWTKSQILRLAQQVSQSGLKSLVCSPHEVKMLKSIDKKFFLATPGIRQEGDELGDQKRTMTAEAALKAGSSALVLGRSVLNRKDPLKVLKQIYKSL